MIDFNPGLILASGSPRRKELLENLNVRFEVFTADVEEIIPESLNVHEVAQYLSRHKNREYRSFLTNQLVLTADTVVVHNDKLMGKPKNKDAAIEMLSELNGSTHEVITGVTMSSQIKSVSISVRTQVTFRYFSDHDILYYVENFIPYDKAGGYGIQEWIGMIGAKSLNGSYYNVVGLPTSEVYVLLTEDFGEYCVKR